MKGMQTHGQQVPCGFTFWGLFCTHVILCFLLQHTLCSAALLEGSLEAPAHLGLQLPPFHTAGMPGAYGSPPPSRVHGSRSREMTDKPVNKVSLLPIRGDSTLLHVDVMDR